MAKTKRLSVLESGRVLYLPAARIRPNPLQPRKHFDAGALQELAESIRQYGVLQPLTVRRLAGGYELVAGERRLRAARLAGLSEVPCLLADVDEESSGMLALVENLQRRDLDYIEEAEGLQKLMQQYHLSQEQLEALELPLLAVPTGGEEYHLSMEAALRRAKEQGAELVCFGDIDMENNRAWGEERCRNVGLEAVYPLWHHDRQENVREVLELGYRCLIKTLDRRVLPRHLLGRVMDRAMVEEMTACGVDVCGENGEFHTIAVDGPVFHRPIPYCVRQLLDLGDYSVADITVPEKE